LKWKVKGAHLACSGSLTIPNPTLRIRSERKAGAGMKLSAEKQKLSTRQETINRLREGSPPVVPGDRVLSRTKARGTLRFLNQKALRKEQVVRGRQRSGRGEKKGQFQILKVKSSNNNRERRLNIAGEKDDATSFPGRPVKGAGPVQAYGVNQNKGGESPSREAHRGRQA